MRTMINDHDMGVGLGFQKAQIGLQGGVAITLSPDNDAALFKG